MMNRRAFFVMTAGAAVAVSGLGCTRMKNVMNKMRGKNSSLDTDAPKMARLPSHTSEETRPGNMHPILDEGRAHS